MAELDVVYSVILKQIKPPRTKSVINLDTNAFGPPQLVPLPAAPDALMDKLKAFVPIYNDTVVHRLVQEGKLEEAKKMLDRNPTLYRMVDMEGDTVLHTACREDRLEFVRWMMLSAAKRGGFYSEEGGEPLFDPNARNYARWTPLHCAAYGFHFKICDLLLKEATVAVNCITEPNQCSPLHFIARYQDASEILSSGIVPDNAILGSSSLVGGSYMRSSASGSSRDALSTSSSSNATTSVSSAISNSPVLKDMVEVLTGLLDAGADLSARDAKGETPLHIAANLGSSVVAEWLVLNRADVGAMSYMYLESPLHVAIRGKNPVIVELLLGASADVNAASKHGSPLELAQQFSAPEIMKLLKDHIRALPLATESSELPVAVDVPTATFASLSTSPNAPSTSGSSPGANGTPIPLSPRKNRYTKDSQGSEPGTSSSVSPNATGIIERNVTTPANSASITIQEHALLGPSATSTAPPPSSLSIPIGGSSSSVDDLSTSNNSSGDSTAALTTSDTSFSSILPTIASLPLLPFRQLRRVVEAAMFSPGRSPLHDAVISNNERMVAEILRLRPNLVNTKDQQRWTPSLYAAAYGHLRLLARLARAGADLSCVDSDESGILHFLARNRKVAQYPLEFADLLDLLVLCGIKLDMANMFGATSLHDASARDNLVFVHSVCQRGAKVDAVTKNGETPLIYAARENCVDAVNFLLHRGASMHLAGKFGSAIDVARNHCNVSVLKVFLFYKASDHHNEISSAPSSLHRSYDRHQPPTTPGRAPVSMSPRSTSSSSNSQPTSESIAVSSAPVSTGSSQQDAASNKSSSSFSVALSSSPSNASSFHSASGIFAANPQSANTSIANSVGRSFKLRSMTQVEPFSAAPTNGLNSSGSSSVLSPTAAVLTYQDSRSTISPSPSSGKLSVIPLSTKGHPLAESTPPTSIKLPNPSNLSTNGTPPRMRSKSESPQQQASVNNSPVTIGLRTPQAPSRAPSSPLGPPKRPGEALELEDADLSEKPVQAPNLSSYLSPRRHLTVTIDGAVIDYNQVYNVHEPLLAVFPCSCTISSPIAVFKEIEGFIIVWQRYIAFGHVTTTSSGALVADYSFNWKVPLINVSTISLVKSLFSSSKVSIAARPEGAAEDAASTVNITLMRCERIEALEKLLQFLFQNRTLSDRIEIDGAPLTDMVGSIMYPKENAEFHRQCPGAPDSETVLDHFTCYHKEEGAFASKTVFVSQHRLCFGKKTWTQLLFDDVKTMRKVDAKTILLETPTQKYTFSSITNCDAVFSLIESVWNAQQSDNRVVLFGALGRRTTQLCELFLEKFVKVASGPDSFYVRWVLIQGYHVLDKRQQEMLRDIGVEVVWISSKSGFLAIPEVLQYMRKVILFYLDFDPKFLEVAEMILRHCSPSQLKQVMLVTLSLGDLTGYMAESIALLQDRVKETDIGFVFINCHPAFLQILEDEFVDVKRDWRFRLPWGGNNPKLAWLDMRDVVDVAVELTTSRDFEQYRDKIFYMAGPEPISCDDIAAVITQLSEQEVRFIGASMEDIKHILLQALTEATTFGPRTTESWQQSLSRTMSMEQYLPAIVTHDMTEVVSFASTSTSTIIKALRPKFSQFEQRDPSAVGLDFDTQQYLTIFHDLASYNLHAISSMITLDLTRKRPRTIHNFVLDHLPSFRSKGAYNFTSAQKDAATRHFTDVAVSLAQTNVTKIDLSNFNKLISPLITSNSPAFANRLSTVFNPEGRPALSSSEYVRTCGVLVNGDMMDQLSLACSLFDSDGDSKISCDDIHSVGLELAAILTALGIEYKVFSMRTLFSPKGLASYPRDAPLPYPSYSNSGVSLASADRPLRESLTQAEFCQVLKMNRTHLSSLGSLSSSTSREPVVPVISPTANAQPPAAAEKIALKVRRNGIYVWPGHNLWESTLRLSAGISCTIQQQMTQGTSQAGELAESDCNAEMEYRVSGPSEPEIWTFHEFGGAVFRKIREVCKISAHDYLSALGIEVTLGNLVVGRLANFEEIFSSGRSGSFFLRTHDAKFLVKSLPLDEHIFLRKNLWRYYKHLADHPNSLLSRFYGLYRVRSASGKQDFHFVVMANLFDTQLEVHEQYDLKGSTVNRYVGDKMPFWSSSIAMKDLDFHRTLNIGPERKAAFLQQAESDAIFMESFNICDYSLLVGFHYSDSATTDLTQHHPLGDLAFMASVPDSPDDYITYYLCNLIDILTQYNLKKRGESAIKSIVHKKSQISAISPNPYRKRFIRFLNNILH